MSSRSIFSIIHSKRYHSYSGTWNKVRRLQNPDIEKQLETKGTTRSEPQARRFVYVCGLGSTGSLGLLKFYRPNVQSPDELRPKDAIANTFRQLPVFTSTDVINDVACGYGFTLVAVRTSKSAHTVIGFGLNSSSQIGYHAPRAGFPLEILATPSPICLPTESPVIRVSCGRSHSLYLDQDGRVFSTGNNSLGQCGRPINEEEIYFGSRIVHQLGDLPDNIIEIECGQDHSLFLDSCGKLYSCGWGADGQTGLGHFETEAKPSRVKGDLNGSKIIKVSSSADTVLALDDQGNVFGWGNSEYAQFSVLGRCDEEQTNTPRQLKLPRAVGKVVDIASGGTMCAVLNAEGQVFVWGYGILGKGPNIDQSSLPTLIPESLFGKNVYSPDTKVVKIYAGLSQFAAINNKGDLFTWGRNRGGLLGFHHAENQFFPMCVDMNLASVKKIAIGVDHTCAIVEKIC